MGELARLFFKLGAISFGGPAAHLALIEDEVVARRKWLTHEQFLDLLGATNLIPGPNSLEMAAHIGYRRAGTPGLLVAAAAFTLPAAVLTAALAWAYLRFGALPEVGPFLAGIKPAVVAVIAVAMIRLGTKALATWPLAMIGLAAAGASLAGINEVLALFAGGFLGSLVLARWKTKAAAAAVLGSITATAHAAPLAAGVAAGTVASGASLGAIALFFLRVGATLYGTGYVLIAYLERGLVHRHGWLGQEQLIDAVAAGQITPGPLISTATFVGYLLAGAGGAAVATLAIILPGLLLVGLTNPLIPRLRRWAWTARFLDAINAASIGLIALVSLRMAAASATSITAILIAVVSAIVLLRWKVSPIWLVLGGAAIGGLTGAI